MRNIPNGKVEGEAQGEEDSIRQFVKDLDKGPELANVIRVDQSEKEVVDGETEFRKVKNPRWFSCPVLVAGVAHTAELNRSLSMTVEGNVI